MKKYRVNISNGYQSSSDLFDSEKEALEQIENIHSRLDDLCLMGLKTSDYKVEMIIEDLKTIDSQSCPECDALASYGSNDGPCEKHKL
jgi:hypothetical protein